MNWSTFAADGAVDWAAVERLFPADMRRAMETCIQDKIFHAEGDVWTHTRMVCEQLQKDPEFAGLPPRQRTSVALAAVWHDVAKPQTRDVYELDGRERVSHHNHSTIGAGVAWRELWAAGVPLDIRLGVYGTIRNHQRIFFAIHTQDLREEVAKFSLMGSCRELAMLARADNRGRIAPDYEASDTNVALARIAAEESGCLDSPWPFPSAQARLRFAKRHENALFFDPQPPSGSRVTVLCGLPGSGKDTYAAEMLGDLPVLSLDALRTEMGIGHEREDNQGQMIQAFREKCREFLRKKTPFVYNATNLTRLLRAKTIDLALDYDAHVTILAFDIPEETVRRQNAGRRTALPEDAFEMMLSRWDPPTVMEAHEVRWIGPDWKIEAKRRREAEPEPPPAAGGP